MDHDGTGTEPVRPSLDGLPREHRLAPTVPQQWLGRVQVLVGLVLVALAIQSSTWWTAVSALLIVLNGALLGPLTRRAGTTLGDDGVRVHNGLTRARLVRWEDVAGLRVRQCWEGPSSLRLRSGREVKLLGVPVEVARALAVATRPARPASASGDRAPVPEDVDRRGRSRWSRSRR